MSRYDHKIETSLEGIEEQNGENDNEMKGYVITYWFHKLKTKSSTGHFQRSLILSLKDQILRMMLRK